MKIHEGNNVITFVFVEMLVMDYYKEGKYRIEIFAHPNQITAFSRNKETMFTLKDENSDLYYLECIFPVEGYGVKVRFIPMYGELFDNQDCIGSIGYSTKEDENEK